MQIPDFPYPHIADEDVSGMEDGRCVVGKHGDGPMYQVLIREGTPTYKRIDAYFKRENAIQRDAAINAMNAATFMAGLQT